MGKGFIGDRRLKGSMWDLRLRDPIYPDQPGKRVAVAGVAMLVFAVAETGAATPAVVWVRSGVAAQSF